MRITVLRKQESARSPDIFIAGQIGSGEPGMRRPSGEAAIPPPPARKLPEIRSRGRQAEKQSAQDVLPLAEVAFRGCGRLGLHRLRNSGNSSGRYEMMDYQASP